MEGLGLYYWKHKIHTRVEESREEPRKPMDEDFLGMYLLCAWFLFSLVMSTRGGGSDSG